MVLENREPAGDEARPDYSATLPMESAVMQILWERRRSLTVQEVAQDLGQVFSSHAPSYTAVLDVLSRLVDQGALERQHDGRGYRYEAILHDPTAPDPAVLQRLRRFLSDEG
jgi:predicted transcriptional regulator